jgi:hypothetical protein
LVAVGLFMAAMLLATPLFVLLLLLVFWLPLRAAGCSSCPT